MLMRCNICMKDARREAELSGIFSDRVASRRKLRCGQRTGHAWLSHSMIRVGCRCSPTANELHCCEIALHDDGARRESLSARMDMLEENENPAPAAKPLKPTPRKLVLEPSPVKSQVTEACDRHMHTAPTVPQQAHSHFCRVVSTLSFGADGVYGGERMGRTWCDAGSAESPATPGGERESASAQGPAGDGAGAGSAEADGVGGYHVQVRARNQQRRMAWVDTMCR